MPLVTDHNTVEPSTPVSTQSFNKSWSQLPMPCHCGLSQTLVHFRFNLSYLRWTVLAVQCPGSKTSLQYASVFNRPLFRVTISYSTQLTYIAMCPDGQNRGRAFRLYQGNRRNQNNICDQPCVFTNMYFGPPVKVTPI